MVASMVIVLHLLYYWLSLSAISNVLGRPAYPLIVYFLISLLPGFAFVPAGGCSS
jgi:hypothetical protein